MRQSLKVAFSLLISIILFSGFAVLAFSGFFNVLETGFFSPRIEREFVGELDSLAAKIEKYHSLNFERFSARLVKEYMASAFVTSQSTDDIAKRVADFGALQKDLPNLSIVRFLDPDGKRLHYSTLSTDVAKPAPGGIEYKTLEQADTSLAGADLVTRDGQSPRLIIDGPNDRFVYSFPVYQQAGTSRLYKGSALFYVGSADLLTELLRIPQTNIANVMLIKRDGVLVNFPAAEAPILVDGIVSLWTTHAADERFSAPLTFSAANGSSETFILFFRKIQPGGFVSLMVNRSLFEMSPVMKGLLLAAFFLTVFLIVYLLFNLRSDPLEVLSQRIKRFQIQLLQRIMENPGGVDWTKWKNELEERKGEITHQMQRGLGRVSRAQKKEVDVLVARSWNEIIDLLGKRAETVPLAAGVSPVDISRLESLIQQALRNAQAAQPTRQVAAPAAALKVEEIRAEEVEELEEEPEKKEEPVEAEELGEAEEVLEAEGDGLEAEDAETVPGRGENAGVTRETEAIEEPGESQKTISDVEELEEVVETSPAPLDIQRGESVAVMPDREALIEAPEELSEVEEIEAPPEDEAAEAPGAEQADLEELEILEEEEVTEVLEVEEEAQAASEGLRTASTVSELVEVRIPSSAFSKEGAESRRRAAEGGTGSSAAIFEEEPVLDTSEETLDELEPLAEIQPLPPEPVEEGLEFLPVADEKAPSAQIEEWKLMSDHEREEENIGSPDTQGRSEFENIAKALKEPSEPQKIEEFEVLEEAPDGALLSSTAEAGKGWSESDAHEEIGKLVASGTIRIYTIEELQSYAEEAKSAIVIENGVYRIKEEVYLAGEKAREGKLKELAEEVIRNEKKEAAVSGAKEDNGFSGIGDLIREEETIDLAMVVGTERDTGAEEALSLEREKNLILKLKKNGIDYDEFISSYPRSFTHTTQMKSLVEVSRRVSAVSAGFLLKGGAGYLPDLAIGANEKTLHGFRFPPTDPFFDMFCDRKAIAVNRTISDIRTLREKIDIDDLKFMKRFLFLPAGFHGKEGYLFFSFSLDSEITLDSVFADLKVQ